MIRPARQSDLAELLRLEQASFSSDRLSRRSFRRWLKDDNDILMVAESGEGHLDGYALLLLRRGTRLARLYSLAVDQAARGRGLAGQLLDAAEEAARGRGILFIRLEVASHNSAAIELYKKRGFVEFGRYQDYYENHDEALRMEKCIRTRPSAGEQRTIPWVPQTTPFTCGPAALMMAMAATDPRYTPTTREEIAIWRESTTIFMTSGHGGCHPVGLALAAHRRGFAAEVWVSRDGPLFVDGVRNLDKKRVMTEVHRDFMACAEEARIPVHQGGFDLAAVEDRFREGANCLLLISTYRMNRRKAPHWVVLSGLDEGCFYLQDPDMNIEAAPEGEHLAPIDCHHLPVARDTLAAMSRFGADRLQASVVISRRQAA